MLKQARGMRLTSANHAQSLIEVGAGLKNAG
jgi:hypothetical protein